jgi:glycosyltransferase involved in cell wall biosynthesis
MTSFFFLSLMNGAPWGGSEELWYRTALHAAAKGYKVGCAFYNWEEKKEKMAALEKAGCRIYLLPNKGRRKKSFLQKLQYKISRWQVNRMIGKLPFHDYSLTVINQGGLEVLTTTWRNAFRCIPAYVLLFHNYNEGDVFQPAKASYLRQWLAKASLNLFAARRIQQMLEEKLDVTIRHPALLLNPITIEPPTAAPSYSPLKSPYLFVMLAELDVTRKAQDKLLEALSQSPWTERDWQLHLYGTGNDKAMLQGLVETLGLSEKVVLKGHTSHVKDVLQEAHLVLQLTHRDAMPLAVVEAMAMGRPVIVSNVGDMPYWVEDGRNGWVAKNASVAEIRAVLEKAWQEKETWPRAGQHSFDLFKEKFPASAEDRLLQQLLQARHQPTPNF